MKQELIIHNAAQVLTCASGGKAKKGAAMQESGLIEDGAIVVNEGVIVDVGKSDEILKNYQSDKMFDARNKVVSPGFVECHTHLVYAGNRFDEFELKIKGAEYLEILKNGGGILSTVEKTRQAHPAELTEQSWERLDRLFANGTTTAEIKTGYGLDFATELKMLDTISELDQTHPADLIPTFLAAHTVPPEYKGKEDEFTNLICEEMLPMAMNWYRDLHFKARSVPFFCDVFCEKNAFNLEQSKRILETAKNLGYKLKAHVDQFTNFSGAKMAIDLGATSIDHLDEISDEEIKMLADSETVGVVTPGANFNHGATKFADARKLIDAGCAVAVSTDYNPGSSPCSSLPTAMAIACRYQKITPAEAFNAATINAAFAVACGQTVGSLEKGKIADILVFATKDYREIVYEFGSNLIEEVFKNGYEMQGLQKNPTRYGGIAKTGF